MLSRSALLQRMVKPTLLQNPTIISNQRVLNVQATRQFHASWFNNFFGSAKKQEEEPKFDPKGQKISQQQPIKIKTVKMEVAKPDTTEEAEKIIPRKVQYQAQSPKKKSKDKMDFSKRQTIKESAKKSREVSNQDLREQIRGLDRSSPSNMYQQVQRQRLTKRELQSTEHLESFVHPSLLANQRVSVQKYNPKEFKRGLEDHETPFPVQATIGPYTIEKPLLGKNYFWCSCGMSKKQPGCDGSHKGTKFSPLKFVLDEKVKNMYLCGCKLTKQAPFCDGITCHQLLNEEPIEISNIDVEAAEVDAAQPEDYESKKMQ